MASGFGVDASADGLSGTSAQDIRRILNAQFNKGVLKGCDVTTSASAMTYTVSSGVVAIESSVGETILAPVDQATVVTASAPVSGTRIDKVYVQQRIASVNGDANVVVGVTSGALPANSFEIMKFTVSPGQTNTNAAVRSGIKQYSIPHQGSMGLLVYHQRQYSGIVSNTLYREGHATINLPTDRRLKFKVTAVLQASGAVGFDNSKYCEYGFLFNVDGADFVLHTTPGLNQALATYEFSSSIELSAGAHDVNMGRLRITGPGNIYTHHGVDGLGFGRRGIEFSVYDEGPIQSSFDVSPSF
jgi:hypothetical protein